MNLNRAIEQALQSWRRSGLSDLPCSEGDSLLGKLTSRSIPAGTVAVAQETETKQPQQPVRSQQPQVQTAPVGESLNHESAKMGVAKKSVAEETASKKVVTGKSDLSLRQRETRLEELRVQVSACQKCEELAAGRTQTVFGVGNPAASVMFIGEAPGADEDKQGEPFVGRGGKLLNTIIEACGWTREELYICNILRCRPPGNRNPSPIEAGNCREFLDGQIEAVDPDYIVCWGTIAAQNLLNNKTPIGRLRGKFSQYGRAKVLCTYHPAYLLRNPSAKKLVWEDLKVLLREMGIDPTKIVKKKSSSQ